MGNFLTHSPILSIITFLPLVGAYYRYKDRVG